MTRKVREAFQLNDWVIQRKDLRNAQSPMYAYKVIANLPRKLRTLQHAIASDKLISSSPASLVELDLSKAHTIKACTLQCSKKYSTTEHMQDRNCICRAFLGQTPHPQPPSPIFLTKLATCPSVKIMT
jgi:hypothetical protein